MSMVSGSNFGHVYSDLSSVSPEKLVRDRCGTLMLTMLVRAIRFTLTLGFYLEIMWRCIFRASISTSSEKTNKTYLKPKLR